MGRAGASKAIKCDFAKNKIKQVGEKYLGRVIDSATSDLSEKISLIAGELSIFIKLLVSFLNQKVDGQLPGHKYTGPYNDLDNQVKYDPTTGEILSNL